MNGERKFVIVMVGVGILCITVLYLVLFIALWSYRTWVGVSLLALLAAVVVAFVCKMFNEQALRRGRYRHQEEIPLDWSGEPRYWPGDAQQNPHRSARSHDRVYES